MGTVCVFEGGGRQWRKPEYVFTVYRISFLLSTLSNL